MSDQASGHADETRGQDQDMAGLLARQVDNLPVQVWTICGEVYGRANSSHAAFLGLPADSLAGRPYSAFLPDKAAVSFHAACERVREAGQGLTTELWMSDTAGERRLLEVTFTPVPVDDDPAGEIVCSAIDVTERLRASAELIRSEENFRRFMETLDDIVLIGDLEGRVIYANPAAARKLGRAPEQLAGRSILGLHPDWARKEAEAILTDMFSGKRDKCPLPLQKADGSLLPVETRIWFGTWSGERCIFGLCKDLSAEQEALQKFDRLFRGNPALMAVTDLDARAFVDVNEAFLKVLGYERDEVIGRSGRELGLFPDPEEQDRAASLLAANGRLHEFELKVKTKGGTIRSGLFSGEIIESQGRRYYLTVMLDITERKKAEAEREQTIRELQNALEQIRTLRGIVPICVSCKKIRDDKGFWEQVDAYVSRHTEAEFSHGICPDCMQTHYPGYADCDNAEGA
jgi:PAS domain S-box-containing protein